MNQSTSLARTNGCRPGRSLRVLGLVLLLGASALAARAEWRELQEGQDYKAVKDSVGEPLIVCRGRNGAQETWTYDCGAYVQFENGRVSFWQAPRSGRKAPAAETQPAP